ncbi:branched-chain amino acid transport system II carrier protein [Clostridium sporogenes]|uniref:Branched-chain amino acid transport system carrier protein n=1 Tax=Clostridium botulinum TaxID=1491 RepID=A0A6M0SZP1_CLOBO|nr:branched-chain amino acid transport system II carrier protein [Clostridium sporogenes]NFA60978.1 branched-chain amino acid transport system II carrier protein [Clostridium botulinum]NFI73573.1 branched-chain amino acid transport system II carrier protein [Clostridium sporogenes]NFL73527.1 branched-chain amino acid transport system II carrier protein [Clostridium sporogenes]NFM25827.1 branched-chain amino acid transport system II carrier protein [Clostridium sporogenes]NFP61179.1 branched-ch
MKKTSSKDFIVIGFALFAMFFGAGNLIFPPFIGNLVGDKVPAAIIGFLITGVGLPLSAIIACAKINGTFSDISSRVGKYFSVISTTALILAIGPMLCIPRTAATTYELTVQPIFPSIGPVVSAIIYFAVCLFFVLRPSGIVDSIGKILTPCLLVMLAIIIIKGLVSPLGPVVSTNFQGAFSTSLLEGYQTMDTMGSVIFASIILASVRSKGYTDEKYVISVTIKSGMVAIVGLGLVYGGLMILGSQTSQIITGEIGRTALVIEIVKRDLGSAGIIILGIAVGLACLTTAIGLLSTGAEYLSKLTKNKVSYNAFAIIISVVSGILGIGGVDKIIKFSVPILQILYPIVIVLIVITLAGKAVKNDSIVKFTVYITLIVSIIDTLNTLTGEKVTFIKGILGIIPLSNVGFSWVVPAIIAFIIGTIIFGNKQGKIERAADY